jgi:hypothetical protein
MKTKSSLSWEGINGITRKFLLPLFVLVCLVGDTSIRAITAKPASPTTTSWLGNISTRAFVQTGDNVMIGGFIIQGTQPKTVIVRAIGPELIPPPYNIPNALAEPTLELHDGTGALIASNDNWQTTIIGGIITQDQVQDIQNSGHAPGDARESAIIATLQPGNYTAIVRGVNSTTGVALVEVYDLSPDATPPSILGNISTRAFVQTGDNVMIGGFIVQGTEAKNVIVRAIGPELGLPPYNIPNALADPTLELHDGTGALIASNDNWQTTIIGGIITAGQSIGIQNSRLAPGQSRESAIIATLAPGNYTAIVRGVNNITGVALVEVYDLEPIILEQVSQVIPASQGGTITLPSGNSASIPAGAFSADQAVSLSLIASTFVLKDDYLDTTATFDAGPAADNGVVVDTGSSAPQAAVSVSLRVPDDFLNLLGASYVPRVYVKAFWQGDDETQDAFELLDSQFDPTSKILTAFVPPWGFTDLRNGRGTFECILFIGSLPAARLTTSTSIIERSTVSANTSFRDFRNSTASTSEQCPTDLYSPLSGLTPDQLSQKISSRYGVRDFILHGRREHQFHTGIDYSATRGPAATSIVPAANGYIVNIRWSITTGQTVIVEHVVRDTNGNDTKYRTSYHHLEKDSIHVRDINGNVVTYPDQPTRANGTNERVFAPGLIPVTGGVTSIGTMDCTGSRCDGSHLHFEFGPAQVIPSPSSQGGRINPDQCITLSPSTSPWNGTWVGTDSHDTFSAGICSYTGNLNVTFTFSVSGTVLSGSGTAIGFPCFYLGDCSINDFPNTTGTISGSVSGTSGSVDYDGTAQNGVCEGQGVGWGFTGMVNGTTITGTTSRGGVVNLTKR